MGALVPFAYGDALVRVVEIDGEPWWVAGDVAKILGYREAYHMLRMLDDDEKGPHIVGTLGGPQEVNVISESGVFHAILKSRRPDAKAFRKWVTSEVLPSIRRNGFYQAPVHRGSVRIDPRTPHLQDLRRRDLTEKEEARRDQREEVFAFISEQIEAGVTKTAALEMARERFGCSPTSYYNWQNRT